MSVPLATIFHGDVTIEQGSDVTQYGYGDLSINRNLVVLGTTDSTGAPSVGTLIVDGGVRIGKSLHVQKDANVLYGKTFLTETHIDTTNGPVTVTGGNSVSINVGAASQFVSTGGNLTLSSSTQSLQLYGGLNGNNAIEMISASGGISMLSGINRGVSIVAGSLGINGYTSSGNITLTANNARGSFFVNSGTSSHDLVLQVNGSTGSQILIESSGTDAASKHAIVLNTSYHSGTIQMSNLNGLSTSGSISVLAGSGGFNVQTNTRGPINIVSQAASATLDVLSANANNDLSIRLRGQTNSSLSIQSDGTNVTKTALQIQTKSSGGNILISQTQGSGKISMETGSGGLQTTTQLGGSISMTANGATSIYTNATTSDYQDLTVSVTGDTNSRVIISSSGKGNDAISLITNNTGGVLVDSSGPVNIQSNNTGGIMMGTSSAVPISIGHYNSTTTIYGDLYVRGTTSTVDQQIVTIDDNIIVLNNSPYGTGDGGVAIRRWQETNNSGDGDVVNDTPEKAGTLRSNGGSDNNISVVLELSASSTNDIYKDYWIKIISGTGAGQVRKIKSYDGTTKKATLYDSNDHASAGSPHPQEGENLITVPNSSSQYALYPCNYVMSIWDESANEFAFICSKTSATSGQAEISHYTNVHLDNLVSNGITTNIINGGQADIIDVVDMTDKLPKTITTPLNYGIYMLYIKPLNDSDSHRAHGIFMIGRTADTGGFSAPGTVVRLISVKGSTLEHLDIQWRASEYPELRYRPAPSTAGVPYKIKIVSL
jgi:hypothetical protein